MRLRTRNLSLCLCVASAAVFISVLLAADEKPTFVRERPGEVYEIVTPMTANAPASWRLEGDEGSVSPASFDGEPGVRLKWKSGAARYTNFYPPGRAGYAKVPCDGLFIVTTHARVTSLEPNSAAVLRWFVPSGEKVPYRDVYLRQSRVFEEYALQYAYKRGDPLSLPHIHTSGTGEVEIKSFVFKLDDRLLKKAGTFCLTNNAPPELAKLNLDIGCRYAYHKAGTDSDEFPYFTPHFNGPSNVISFSDEGYTGSDGHRVGGWIPAKEGYLTDGLIGTGVGWGRYYYPSSGYDVVFDLGVDCLIDEVEILCPATSIRNASLYLKSANDRRYVMTQTLSDLVAFDKNGYDERANARFAGVNAGARWVRLDLVLDQGGISEVRIWGRPFREGEAPPAKVPYRQGGGKVVKENPGELPGLPQVAVFPLPQEMEEREGRLRIGPDTRIVIASLADVRARMTAEVMQEGIFTRSGLKLPIGVQGRSGDLVLKEDPAVIEKPEGYVPDVTSEGAVVAGRDPVGTFYGAQSLLQLLTRDGNGGWRLPCVRVCDWPATPIRYVEGGQAVTPALIRALARFKINYYAVTSDAVARADLATAEKYCVKLTPTVIFNWAWVPNPAEFTERAEGEDLAKIGTVRRNPCPSHPGMWEAYFKQMDEVIAATNSDIVNINADEMYFPNMGSRWNVCPRCRARHLTGHDLWVETLKKIHAHVSSRGRKFMMIDSILNSKGISNPDDAANDWRNILDLLPPDVKKDMVVYLWHATDPVYGALVRNHVTTIRWSPYAGFVEKQGFPGLYSGFFLNQQDGPMDPGQIVAMAQLCWSPERSRGGQGDSQRFLVCTATLIKFVLQSRKVHILQI